MSSAPPSRPSNPIVWLLGLFALSGATLFALPRHSDPPPKPGPEPARETKPDAPAPTGRASNTLQVLIDHFTVESPEPPEPRGLFGRIGAAFGVPGGKPERAPEVVLADSLSRVHPHHTHEYEFLIATVPDPLGSKFAHEFDATVDGIQRAYEAREFLLRAAQLPWPRPGGRTGADVKATAGPSDHPGVLLFRQARDPQPGRPAVFRYAVVCLVGENPTSGLNQRALTEALDARAQLARAIADAGARGRGRIIWAEGQSTTAPDKIQLVAPYFTGSQTPLLHTLYEWREKHQGVAYRIVNGNATGLRPIGFTQWGREWDIDPPESTVVPGHLLLRGVLRYLAGSRDTNLDAELAEPIRHRVAILRETNTGFGALSWQSQQSQHGQDRALFTADNEPLDLPFPISISQLAAREEEMPPAVALPRTGYVEPRLPTRDESRFDTVPSYDPASSASTAGQSLRTIMTTIDRARVRYVGIVASDTRDIVFLNRLLQKECPRARVFTTQASVAMLHPDEAARLRGTVVASTYPLSPSAQAWGRTALTPRRTIPFPTQGSQGYYNAVLAHCGRFDLVLGYHPPTPGQREPAPDRPPIWISVIGQGGRLVPVHYYTQYDEGPLGGHVLRAQVTDQVKQALQQSPGRGDRVPEDVLRPERNGPRINVSIGALLGSLLGAGALFAALLALLAPGVWRRAAAGVTESEREVYELRDTVWVWIWRGVVLAGLLLIAVPFALPAREIYDPCMPASVCLWRHWLAFGLAWVIVGELLLTAVLLGHRGMKSRRPTTSAKGQETSAKESKARATDAWACFALAALVLATGAGALGWASDTSPVERFFLYVRATDLTAGLSPLVPMCLLGTAVVVLGWCCLRQADLARRTRFRCPYPGVWSRLRDADAALNNDFNNPLRFLTAGPHLPATMGLAGAFLLCLVWNAIIIPLPSEEGAAWDILMRIAFWTTAGTVVLILARFLALWTRLATLLEEVLRVPMVHAFELLPYEIGRLFGGYLYSQRPRHRQLATVAWTLPPDERKRLAEEIKKSHPGLAWVFGTPTAATSEGPPPADTDQRKLEDQQDRKWLADQLQKTAGEFLADLPEEWQKRSVDAAFGADHNRAPGAPAVCPPEPPDPKEEFVAAFVVLYLGSYFAQLRALVYALAGAAPLLLFAAASYPFQPDRPRLTALLALLVAVALATVYVLYRINRDGLISRITRTTPNRFTPDSGFLSSVATYVLPLATLALLEFLGVIRFIIEPVLGLFD